MSNDRKWIESRDNWQATVWHGGGFDCLMRTFKGGYYWYTPDYRGMFAWGATRQANLDWIREDVASGRMRVVAGNIPVLGQTLIQQAKEAQ